MSTFSPNADTTIDIGEGIESDIQTATIGVTGVEETETNATEIKFLAPKRWTNCKEFEFTGYSIKK